MAAIQGNGTTKRDAPAAADRFIGVAVAGRYRIQSVIARGGVGRVYKGVQEPLGRFVAIKLLDPLRVVNDTQAEAHTKRFLREATVSSRLNHPNTVVVHDYGTLDDGRLFLVMEYLEGPTLRQALQQDGALQVPRALHIAKQMASSLIDAHEAGVVHRDLKPPNIILVTRGGDRDFVKVVDFGLVKSIYTQEDDDLTVEGSFVGSPAYMSPEQATGQTVDQRTDIYSFGTILYEMLAGRPPFRGQGERPQAGQLIAAHLTEKPPALADVRPGPRLPMMLEALVMQCLAKSPQLRPKSMREVLSVIEQVEREVGTGGTWGPLPERTEAGAGAPVVPPAPPQSLDAPSGSSTHGVAATPPASKRRIGALAAAGVLLLAVGYLGARWLDSGGQASSEAPAPPAAPAAMSGAPEQAAPSPSPGAAGGSPAQATAPGDPAQAQKPAPSPSPGAAGGSPAQATAPGDPAQAQKPAQPAEAAPEEAAVAVAPATPAQPAVVEGTEAPAAPGSDQGSVVLPSQGPSVALAVQPPTEAPAEPAPISVRIESVPKGADVLLGDEVLGPTPLSTLVAPEDLATRSWTVRKAGFRDAPAQARAPADGEDEVVVTVELVAIPKAPAGNGSKGKTLGKTPGQKTGPKSNPPRGNGGVDIQLTR